MICPASQIASARWQNNYRPARSPNWRLFINRDDVLHFVGLEFDGRAEGERSEPPGGEIDIAKRTAPRTEMQRLFLTEDGLLYRVRDRDEERTNWRGLLAAPRR
jgi:hypothetical protein